MGLEVGLEGALSLRFLQGPVAMLPTQLLSVLHKPVAYAFVVSALRQEREGRGTPQKTRRNGAPTVLAMPARSKARATRPNVYRLPVETAPARS